MADVTIGSAVNYLLAGLNRDVEGKELSQRRDGPPAKCDACEHQADSAEEDQASSPQYGCLWEAGGKSKVQRQPNEKHNDDEPVRSPVAGAVAGTFCARCDKFEDHPQ